MNFPMWIVNRNIFDASLNAIALGLNQQHQIMYCWKKKSGRLDKSKIGERTIYLKIKSYSIVINIYLQIENAYWLASLV